MNHGFIKVASAIPSVKVADCQHNLQEIEQQIAKAEGQGVEVITFPELAITGYTCGDLFHQQLLLDAAEQSVLMLLDFTRQLDIIVIVGAPVSLGNTVLDCAVVIQRGEVLAIVPKVQLDPSAHSSEGRWFSPGADLPTSDVIYAGSKIRLCAQPLVFETYTGVRFGVLMGSEIGQVQTTASQLVLAGADVLFTLGSRVEQVGAYQYLKRMLASESARMQCAIVYASSGFGESTQDVVHGGDAFIFENGTLLAQSGRFKFESQIVTTQIDSELLRAERKQNALFTASSQAQTSATLISCHSIEQDDFVLTRPVCPTPFIPTDEMMDDTCEEVLQIQVAGLAKRLIHTGCKTVVLGISGGLDSTLALVVCARTFDKLRLPRTGIIGVTMPGFGTTDRTYNNALTLMSGLGITMREISIRTACEQHFADLGHDLTTHDAAYENAQARERTQILMDLANMHGGMVVGTGDMSELALGWATYNGDHMSMYDVNASVPKTLIPCLVRYVAARVETDAVRTSLLDVVDTPISPELTPADADGNIAQKS